MTANELHLLLSALQPPVLINVLPADVFDLQHIPGSLNACVYEIAFAEKVRELVPSLSTAIVAHGAGEGGLEAKVAGERLAEIGYTEVSVFAGGIDAWKAAGFPVEGPGAAPVLIADGLFTVDTDSSVIRWTGRNLFNHHHGTLRLAGGRIEVRDARLIAADFEIDMSSIVCDDIPDETMRGMLVRHLMHADFFDVGNHPHARFETSTADPISGATDGTPNYEIAGDFTLRGVRRPLGFPVVLAWSPDGSKITAQAQLEIDRTEFGSLYGSGKFFRHLGQHLVNDHFHAHLKIHAAKSD